MKAFLLCLFYFLFAPVGTQNPTSANEVNSVAIEKALTDFGVALAIDDTITLKHLTGSTFVLLEEGRTFDFQAMISSIQQVFATGAKMKRLPSHFHTEIRGLVAWSNYRVTGEFESNQGKILLSLLEAAVLEKVGDQWRIVQLTTIPAIDK